MGATARLSVGNDQSVPARMGPRWAAADRWSGVSGEKPKVFQVSTPEALALGEIVGDDETAVHGGSNHEKAMPALVRAARSAIRGCDR